jgi:hypothetical protein
MVMLAFIQREVRASRLFQYVLFVLFTIIAQISQLTDFKMSNLSIGAPYIQRLKTLGFTALSIKSAIEFLRQSQGFFETRLSEVCHNQDLRENQTKTVNYPTLVLRTERGLPTQQTAQSWISYVLHDWVLHLGSRLYPASRRK